MRDRDLPCYCVCAPGGTIMQRDVVYDFGTKTNEASRWPYMSEALLPRDAELRARYHREGRIDADGRVKIESEADYKRVCKEQGVKPQGDYEKINTSVQRPHAIQKRDAKKARKAQLAEKIKRKIVEKGVSL